MSALQLFSLAQQRAEWLSRRQELIASNIANVSTPGYKGHDLEPFSAAIDSLSISLASTNVAHLSDDGGSKWSAASKTPEGWEVSVSGNTVTIEQELLKAGEIRSAFALDNAVVHAFHKMVLSVAR